MNNQIIKQILTRKSYSKVGDGGPGEDDIEVILKSGMSANDHGRLKPWEFRVFSRNSRSVLREAFIRHVSINECSDSDYKQADELPMSAPLVICVSTLFSECKITKKDQLLSAGSACQLITLTSHLLGYASKWRTGIFSESSIVKESLGISTDNEIVAFIFVGSLLETKPTVEKYFKERVISYV